MPELKKGQHLGAYKLIDKIGGGGQGGVWKAQHRENQAIYAIKILHEHGFDARSLGRFKRELQTAKKMKSQQFARIWDWDLSGDCKYIVQDFIPGNTVAKWVKENQDVSVEIVLRFAQQVAEGLSILHSNGMAHRDLSGGNIIIADSAEFQAVIVDLGLVIDSDDNSTRFIGGTVGFIPSWDGPERYVQRDLYNLGQLMACMCLSQSVPLGPVELREKSARLHPLIRSIIFSLVSEDWRTVPDTETLVAWISRIFLAMEREEMFESSALAARKRSVASREISRPMGESVPSNIEYAPDTDEELQELYAQLRAGKRFAASEIIINSNYLENYFAGNSSTKAWSELLIIMDHLKALGLSEIMMTLGSKHSEKLPKPILLAEGFDQRTVDVGFELSDLELHLHDELDFKIWLAIRTGDSQKVRELTSFASDDRTNHRFSPAVPWVVENNFRGANSVFRIQSVIWRLLCSHRLNVLPQFTRVSKRENATWFLYVGYYVAHRLVSGLPIDANSLWIFGEIREYLSKVDPRDRTLFEVYVESLVARETGSIAEWPFADFINDYKLSNQKGYLLRSKLTQSHRIAWTLMLMQYSRVLPEDFDPIVCVESLIDSLRVELEVRKSRWETLDAEQMSSKLGILNQHREAFDFQRTFQILSQVSLCLHAEMQKLEF